MIGTGNLPEGLSKVNRVELLSVLNALCQQNLVGKSRQGKSHLDELGLTETGQFLKQMVKLAGLGCWIWGEVEDRCIYCSDELATMNGLSVEQYYAERGDLKASLERIHPEDRTHYYRSICRANKSKQHYSVEFRKLTSSNKYRIYREQGEPIIDANNELVYTVGIFEDITETRQLEEDLRDREFWFRELFEDSPVSLWAEDWSYLKEMLDTLVRDGVQDLRAFFTEHHDRLCAAYDAPLIIDISKETLRIYRATSKQELTAISDSGHADPEELAGFRDQIVSLYDGAASYNFEAQETACDGSRIYTRMRTVIPSRYRDTWSRVFISVLDITDEKIHEGKSLESQKLNAVGQLATVAAHDFNTALAVIRGKAEMVAGSLRGDSEDARHLEAIIRSCDRGTNLADQLLAFMGKQAPVLQPVKIDNIVVEMMNKMLQRKLGEAIEIEEWPTPTSWSVLAEPDQVKNVILTLAINARAAMPHGGKLRVAIENVSISEKLGVDQESIRPGDYVMLVMSHSGQGMPPEVSEEVFEPCFIPSDMSESSGLGLAMVYGFVQQLGGHVAVESEQGCGMTFRLYLPRYDSKPGQNRPSPPRADLR